MANTLSIISVICFAFAGICLVITIALFYVLNVKGAYQELKGLPDHNWIMRNADKRRDVSILEEMPTRKLAIEDDIATTILHLKGEQADESCTKDIE